MKSVEKVYEKCIQWSALLIRSVESVLSDICCRGGNYSLIDIRFKKIDRLVREMQRPEVGGRTIVLGRNLKNRAKIRAGGSSGMFFRKIKIFRKF